MNDYFARFTQAPASFKKSFAMLVVAWAIHPIYIYAFFYFNQAVVQAQSVILRMAVVSGCLALLLFLIKKWARALVVMGNCFIVVYDIFILAISPSNKALSLLCVGVVLFAILGTYWLFGKDSRSYFSQLNPKQETGDPLDPKAGSNLPK
ncbi:hypothetical protein [uncultured Desulfosarcina sp.]|uniref:hypothetical protein n=1 Tax=uncultured Desulfosarcina sp. TaxID=218289 RepID=UPI0029C60955|nr:hypothetical protein [uncultured Desulfosarcina sp.]